MFECKKNTARSSFFKRTRNTTAEGGGIDHDLERTAGAAAPSFPTIMSLTTVLKASTVIGTGYALNCLLMTDQYLKDQGIASTNETKYLVRGLAGGVVGIVVATYHAAFGNFGDEMKKAIAMANISAFSLWTLSSVNQVVNIATKEKGPKVDLAICTVMLSSFVGAMVM